MRQRVTNVKSVKKRVDILALPSSKTPVFELQSIWGQKKLSKGFFFA